MGARPNFVKAAPVIRSLDRRDVKQVLLHTGQHSSPEMSDAFFRDLDLPQPDVFLGVRPGSAARQIGSMLVGLERELAAFKPAVVVVYGDVNSTLAAALVAANLELPIAHVEAGLRSFDLTMPEEINRRVVDTLAEILFATLPEAVQNLAAEGVAPERVHHVGNPMIDSLLESEPRLDPAGVAQRLGLPARYVVATLHRQSNVNSPEAAATAVNALADAAQVLPVVLPLHPRGRRSLRAAGLDKVADLTVVPPLGYLNFISLLRGAAAVVTDSGGVQEEATYLGVQCLTLRPNTERPSTVTLGTNRLVSPQELAQTLRDVLARPPAQSSQRSQSIPLWDGRAGERIAEVLVGWLANRAS